MAAGPLEHEAGDDRMRGRPDEPEQAQQDGHPHPTPDRHALIVDRAAGHVERQGPVPSWRCQEATTAPALNARPRNAPSGPELGLGCPDGDEDGRLAPELLGKRRAAGRPRGWWARGRRRPARSAPEA
jgi:hypothetical protein